MLYIPYSYDWSSKLKERKDTIYVIVHHAQIENCNVNDIHNWHKNQNGWAGIGYHYFVNKQGLIYQGRPENTIGAHARGYNYNSIGICLEGDYTKEKLKDITESTLINLLVDIKKRYPKIKILRHCDVNDSRCPGEIDFIKILCAVENKFKDSLKKKTLEEKVTSLEEKVTSLEEKVTNFKKTNSKILEILKKNKLNLR